MMRKKNCFTLAELLLVIAILCLLCVLLFPVFLEIRLKSKGIQCFASLRQLCGANLLYAASHQNYLVPYSPNFSESKRHYWFGGENPGSEESDSSLLPYLNGNLQELACPAFLSGNQVQNQCGGYGLNRFMGISRKISASGNELIGLFFGEKSIYQSGYPLFAVQRPASKIMFGDTAEKINGAADLQNSFQNHAAIEPWNEFSSLFAPSIHFRHQGGEANFVFADGHAESLRMESASPCPLLGLPWSNSADSLALHYIP